MKITKYSNLLLVALFASSGINNAFAQENVSTTTGSYIFNVSYLYGEDNYYNSTISVDDDFYGLSKVDSTGGDFGGAILNYAYADGDYGDLVSVANIETIDGDFDSNFTQNSSDYAAGGAIANIGSAYLAALFGDYSVSLTSTTAKIGTITASDTGFTNNSVTASSVAYGGAIVNAGYIDNIYANFSSNNANATTGYAIAYGGAIANFVSITNITGVFSSNYTTAVVVASGGAIYNEGYISTLTADFDSNYVYSENLVSVGGAISNVGTIDSIVALDLGFTNNSSIAGNNSSGGAIYNEGTIKSIVSDFTGNNVYTYVAQASGGAIYNEGDILSLSGNFVGNYTYGDTQRDAGDAYGGAIYNKSGSITITSSTGESYVNIGNFATTKEIYTDEQYTTLNLNSNGYLVNSDGDLLLDSTDDANGGFLYLDSTYYNETTGSSSVVSGSAVVSSSSVVFNTAENSSITIGDGTVGYDSIASLDYEAYSLEYSEDTTSAANRALITKTGLGTLTVNSSMQYFYGVLSVEEGEMAVNNGLGACSIIISDGATLSATIKGDNTFNSTLLGSDGFTYSNEGTLKLIASVGLTETSYSISASEYITDLGDVVAYGGTVSGNIFKVSDVNTDLSVDDDNEDVIKIENNGILSVTSGDTAAKIVLSFNADYVEVTSVTSIATSSDSSFATFVDSNIAAGDTLIAFEAFYFDIDLGSDDSVVVSFYVGEGYDISQFVVYHSEDGSTDWEIADISDLSYEDEYLSFIVNDFSAYGYSIAVPEPSTYAMIFGALALGLAVYRRRK